MSDEIVSPFFGWDGLRMEAAADANVSGKWMSGKKFDFLFMCGYNYKKGLSVYQTINKGLFIRN